VAEFNEGDRFMRLDLEEAVLLREEARESLEVRDGHSQIGMD
jgi:hypothetical protein